MALFDTTWYCNAGDQATTGHYAVPKRPQNTAVVVGQLCRQFTAPAVGSERVFVCSQAGTTANTTDASWTLTRASATVDGTAKWIEATGQASLNDDAVNTLSWTQAKAVIGALCSAGQIIKRNNGVSYQLCITQMVMAASEPAFSDVAGTTTAEGSGVWVSLGPVGNFTGGQAPFARLASVCAVNWFAAGHTIYVGDNHAESQATAITIQPLLIICHNHSGSYPPTSSNLATTATISTTAAVAITILASNGAAYFYGLSFIVGVGQSGAVSLFFSSASSALNYFDSCTFKLATTSNTATGIVLTTSTTSSACATIWNNCQVSFANAAQYIVPSYTSFIWQNTGQVLAAGSSVPTNLLAQLTTGLLSNIILEALDLSQITSVFGPAVASTGNWVAKDCKLNASATFATPFSSGQVYQYVRSSA